MFAVEARTVGGRSALSCVTTAAEMGANHGIAGRGFRRLKPLGVPKGRCGPRSGERESALREAWLDDAVARAAGSDGEASGDADAGV